MATESVDEILRLPFIRGKVHRRGKPFEQHDLYLPNDPDYYIPLQKAALDAYYTRECARKVLEGRKEQVMQDFLELSVASFTDGIDEAELMAWRDRQLAELRAALEEVGGA